MKLCRFIAGPAFVSFLFASISVLAGGPEPVWGTPKDGVIIGVWHNTNMPENGTIVVYACQCTNYMRDMVKPTTEYEMIKLEVKPFLVRDFKESSEGLKYGERLNLSPSRSTLARNRLTLLSRYRVDDPDQIGRFEINKCFDIARPETFELEIQVRLLKRTKMGTKERFSPVIFEPITLKLNLVPNSEH